MKMKSMIPSSIFNAKNSIPLIIFVFIFIAVGMYFIINKTTKKEAPDNSYNSNLETKMIEQRKNEQVVSNTVEKRINNANNLNQGRNNILSMNPTEDNISGSFKDEVGLFIKKDNNNNDTTNPLVYARAQVYIPPFGSGTETRCVARQIKHPTGETNFQNSSNSNLVKYSANATD